MSTAQQLFDFIAASPTAYHTVATLRERLGAAGYTELPEEGDLALTDGGKYFVTRNGSSLIAFRYRAANTGYMIAAAHGDSPAFRVKPCAETVSAYTRLEVEGYGGMIHYTWLDRPLSVAGRVVVRTPAGVASRLVNWQEDMLVIPSVAIHMNRAVNDGYKFNPAVDMLPTLGGADRAGSFLPALASAAGVAEGDILGHDLFLYNREPGRCICGGAYILSPRLDDLACVFAALCGFLSATPSGATPVLAVFDNEEVGSATKQGAASTFLHDVLSRISGGEAKYRTDLRHSFMVSADNAHALHPNHPELADRDHAPLLGGGVVVKYNANQRYTTDGISDALFTEICRRAGVPVQRYCNRADIPGGSTLGSISNTRVSVPTVDIGIAQWAMHAATETASAADLDAMVQALCAFYSHAVRCDGEGFQIL